MMYVPAGEANEIVIIDLNTNQVIGRIPELENAHGLAATPDGEYLLAGSMNVSQTGNIEADRPAAVSEEQHASHHAKSTGKPDAAMTSFVSLVHLQHGHVMRRIVVNGLTHHVAVSPDGKFAVAVHSLNGGISVIDLDSMAVSREIKTGELPNYAVFSSDGRQLYVSNAGSGTIVEIDTADWKTRRTFQAGKGAEHMVLAPDGKRLYVTNVDKASVSVVDLTNGNLLGHYEIGPEPHGIDISPDGRWLFVSSRGGEKFVRIDLENAQRQTIDLKPAPYHVKYVPSVHKLYVSSSEQPLIWVLDPRRLAIEDTISIETGIAHQMVTHPDGKAPGSVRQD